MIYPKPLFQEVLPPYVLLSCVTRDFVYGGQCSSICLGMCSKDPVGSDRKTYDGLGFGVLFTSLYVRLAPTPQPCVSRKLADASLRQSRTMTDCSKH